MWQFNDIEEPKDNVILRGRYKNNRYPLQPLPLELIFTDLPLFTSPILSQPKPFTISEFYYAGRLLKKDFGLKYFYSDYVGRGSKGTVSSTEPDLCEQIIIEQRL